MYVAGGFWAVVLYYPMWEKHWASNVISPKAGSHGQGVNLNRQSGMGPITDSPDHRAGACHLLPSLSYDEFCCTVGLHSLSVPPSIL